MTWFSDWIRSARLAACMGLGAALCGCGESKIDQIKNGGGCVDELHHGRVDDGKRPAFYGSDDADAGR